MGRTALLAMSLALAALAAGCPQRNYKLDADQKAYELIDAQWDPSFGPKVNYRVSDVSPSPNDLAVDRYAAVPAVLTLPHAVAMATANNREYQTQKELLYTTALNQRLVRHGYETQLFGGGSLLYSNDGTDEVVQAEANVGFNRLLASGALISTRVGVHWVDVLLGQGDRGFASVFGATVAQPLLRGSDRMVVLEPLTQAKRDTLYQIRSFNRFRKVFVVSVITQYYEVLEQRALAANAQEYYNSLLTLHDRVEKLVSAARLESEELDRIKQELLRARDRWILAQREHDRFLDAFKITLGVPPTSEFELDWGVYEALLNGGIPQPDFAVSEAVETGLSRRLDLINQADMVLDAQRAVYVTADALRAGLAVGGSVDVSSRGQGAVTAGPVLDLPLDRVAEQVAYRNALIALNQRQREYEQMADTVRLEVREAHRKLQETAERYLILTKGLKLAQERIEKNYLLLAYGRVSSRRVLDGLQHLHDAKNELADALTDYAIATLNFYRDTDVMQVRPDGMWEIGQGSTPLVRTTSSTEKTLPLAR
ncbi:MAG: TolC family protein [Phycisphaerae bacterium]|nr:TolC family protein [Phycisphaerae bacterium]HON92001.1 TolC family protein [Sedimentisphaerales bacterium]